MIVSTNSELAVKGSQEELIRQFGLIVESLLEAGVIDVDLIAGITAVSLTRLEEKKKDLGVKHEERN